MIYQHWVGAIKIEAKNRDISERQVDLWLPDMPQNDAEMIGQDNWEDEIIFPGLLRTRAKIGPFKATVTLNAAYTGSVEYWREK